MTDKELNEIMQGALIHITEEYRQAEAYREALEKYPNAEESI